MNREEEEGQVDSTKQGIEMKRGEHILSKLLQAFLLISLSALFGVLLPFQPKVAIPVLALLFLMLFVKVVLYDYFVILVAIIVVIPFNFESLIAAINIPFVNPFNMLWISYIGIVVLRATTYSEPILVRSPLNLPIFFMIVSYTISFIQSRFVVDGHHFKDHLFPSYQQWLQWILFYYFCLKGIRNEEEAKKTVFCVMIMILFAGVQNIRDYIGMMAATSGNNLERAAGLFNNANYSASFFCYYVPPAIGLALANLPKMKHRWLFMAVSGIGLIAVVVTYSRGGMLAVAMAGAIIAFFSKINPKMVLGLLIVVALAASSDNIRKRFSQTSQEGPYGKTIDPSVHARLVAWSKAFHLIKESPIIGHGFFTFRYIKVEKYEDEAAKAHGSHGMAVHNGFLNILVNAGVVGLLTFLIFMACEMKMCWYYFRTGKDPFWRGLALGLFAASISLLFVNMTGTRLYDRQMVAYFWILLAALYKGNCYSKASHNDNRLQDDHIK